MSLLAEIIRQHSFSIDCDKYRFDDETSSILNRDKPDNKPDTRWVMVLGLDNSAAELVP